MPRPYTEEAAALAKLEEVLAPLRDAQRAGVLGALLVHQSPEVQRLLAVVVADAAVLGALEAALLAAPEAKA